MMQRFEWVGVLLGVLVCVLSASVARADEATARLRDGGVVSGTIEIYEPGGRLVLRTASGDVVTLTHEQLAELHITPTSPRAAAPSVPSPPPISYAPPPAQALPPPPLPPAPYATEYQLVPVQPDAQQAWAQPAQPARPPLRLPRLTAPLVMMSLGATMLAVGGGLISSSYCYDDYYYGGGGCYGRFVGGVALASTGAALLLVGAGVILPIQLARRARRRRAYAHQLALSPTVDPVGGRYGMAGALRF